VGEISSACREQDAGVSQINRSIQQLDQVTQQNAAASEEVSATSEELSGQAERLLRTISHFRVDAKGATADEAVRNLRGKAKAMREKEAGAPVAAPKAKAKVGVALDLRNDDAVDQEFRRTGT
jgi:methyl-accepting chemotaxis protein